MKPILGLVAILCLTALALAGGAPPDVLVVVNGSDPDSVAIGEHYRAARSIPERNLCRLDLKPGLTCDLKTYKERIEGPVRDHLLRTGLAGRVAYVVCCRGVPILVGVGGGPLSTAALLQVMDTEISGRNRPPLPRLRNPYLHGAAAFSYGPETNNLYLVTYLTGFTVDDSKALVDRAIAAEVERPKSPAFLFQDAGGGASQRNRMYPNAATAMREKGLRAEHLKRGADQVRDRDDIMVWMSGGSYSGLNEKGIESNRYPPGAIVDMLESFGAVPRNFDPEGKPSQVPVTWYIRHGITGIHGAVAEPYAHTFPDTSLPLRYVSGFNLAESFHGSLQFLYWMSLVIGDPLCTPFARRPTVTVAVDREGSVEGAIGIEVSTEGEVEEIEVYVDGVLAGRRKDSKGRVDLDMARFADGPHRLLVVARGPAPLRTSGWTVARLEIENPGIVPLDARIEDGALVVRLNRGKTGEDPVRLVVSTPAGQVEGRTEVDGKEARFVPSVPFPAGVPLKVSIGEASVALSTLPAALLIEAPETAKAGERVTIEVTAADGQGEPIAARDRIIALRSTRPPVTLAESAGPTLSPSVILVRAGDNTLVAVDRLSGLRAERAIRVEPGEFTTLVLRPPGSVLVGVPFDVGARAMDRFGNRVETVEGAFRLAASEDQGATTRGTLKLEAGSRGEGIVQGVVLSKEGRQVLVAIDASGKQVGRAQLTVRASRLTSWLVLPGIPVPKGREIDVLDDDLLGGEATVEAARGSVHAGRVWGELNAKREPVDPGRFSPGKSDAVIHALCWVQLGAVAGETRLEVGHGPALAVLVNGRRVYRATSAGKGPGGFQAVPGTVPVVEGWNRILVKAMRIRGQCKFRLRLVDAAGNVVPARKVQLTPPGGLKAFGISGRVASGESGVPGLRVQVRGPETVEVTTDAIGRFAVGGLPAGTYTVAPVGGGLRIEPASREARLEKSSAEGLDFQVTDTEPPRAVIRVPEARATVGRWCTVVVEATDNVGVMSVRLEIDDRAAGDPMAKAPWNVQADMKPFDSGRRRIVAIARDSAGNETRSAPVEVVVDLDTKAPKIRVIQPRRGKTVVGKRMKIEVEVRDDDVVATVELLVDGKPFKAWEAVRKVEETLDVAKLGSGSRTLTFRATDASGNVAEVKVPIKKR